jgi:hypothetical protein
MLGIGISSFDFLTEFPIQRTLIIVIFVDIVFTLFSMLFNKNNRLIFRSFLSILTKNQKSVVKVLNL